MIHGRSRSLRAATGLAAAVACLFGGNMTAKADLGLSRDAYGVWDREGGHSVSTYPYTRGQEYQAEWTEVNPARNSFNWAALDARAQFAYDQNQRFFVKIQPVSSTTVPPWIFSAGVPQINTSGLTYGYYLDPEFKLYFSEMVAALGKHLRQDLPAHLRSITSFVRCDTGATGDEGPYDPADLGQVPSQYLISDTDWRDYRIWAFGLYDQAMQHGTGTAIPIIFQDVETPAFQIEQDWVKANVTSGWGAKYGGQVRGHHLTESQNVPDSFKAYAMDTPMNFFSANEMDQTWEKPYFQLNVPLGFYWCAAESLNAGLSIQDWSGSALEGAAANNFVFAATFFNEWAAELDPPTARGGFCIFHEGLDSADTNKFPIATYGAASKGNTARYTAICAAYSSQGAKMDDLNAATWGQVAQRRDQRGFNDAGWEIWPDNYERFITQINPDNTSKAVWRVSNLTTSSNPYDRFARRFDSASGKNTMYFDVNDRLTPTSGQSIRLSVVYLDKGTGQFGLLYDAVGNSQKSAFTVTKANSGNWKTNSVVVTDWVFGNHGPNGADLILTSVDSNDDTFSRIELVKLVNVTMNVVGQGTVSARNDFTVYSPVTGTYPTGTRLEMICAAGSGYEFSGWSGGLSGTNARAILFPTSVNTTVTATFENTGAVSATDDFQTGTWSGGTGWTGGWSTSGGAVVEVDVGLTTLTAHLTANGQITRVATTPVTGAQLAFDWHIKSLESGESAQAEIYDGSWHVVWTKASLLEESGIANINLSAYGSISQVRFTVNAGGVADHLWIDDVSLSGYSGAPVNNAPVFTTDPMSRTNATVGTAYTGQTLAGSATDADGDTLTYSAQSGPSWLNVASSGALSGTPGSVDVGNNSWTVQVSDGNGGTDTAVLNITVNAASANPTFVAAGAVAGGTGTIAPALPAGLVTGDILLLFVETANQACSISNPNGGTWTVVTGSPQGTGTAGGTAATMLTAFWSRYNGTQGAPTVSDSGDHTIGRMIAIRGAVASGNPWDVTAGGVEATADTSGSIPGATTTVANTLVVTAVAASLPDATSTAVFSGWANANLTSLTERTDNANKSNNGGALGVATGVKATAGAYGNTTVTHSSAAVKGMMSIAIKK